MSPHTQPMYIIIEPTTGAKIWSVGRRMLGGTYTIAATCKSQAQAENVRNALVLWWLDTEEHEKKIAAHIGKTEHVVSSAGVKPKTKRT